MTVLPLDPPERRTPDALRGFLRQCQAAAAARKHPQLVSISIRVGPLDPLAVLESIFEPTERHFYVERPAAGFALAGAEAVTFFSATGPGRFQACRRFIADTLEHTFAVGEPGLPLAGPLFFAAFTFEDQEEAGAPFEAASVFVPRWQVATSAGESVAVAHLMVEAASPIEPMADRVWRAHAKFAGFDYTAAAFEGDRARSAPLRERPPAEDYCRSIAAAVEEIAAGSLDKIVVARTKELATDAPLHPLRVLNGLRERYSDCYAFSVANGRGQSFIGASPERLLRLNRGRLLTEALAGSARRGVGASEDAARGAALLRDDKERREHRMVVEAIVEQLRRLGLEPRWSERPGLRRFATVQHLHTPIEAEVPAQVHLLDIAGRLHPTPAVGGVPRDRALARIPALEGFARGLYAGALGWIDGHGGGELLVGLRSALIDRNRAVLYAGAGVVAGSDPANELAETELKFRAIQEALAG